VRRRLRDHVPGLSAALSSCVGHDIGPASSNSVETENRTESTHAEITGFSYFFAPIGLCYFQNRTSLSPYKPNRTVGLNRLPTPGNESFPASLLDLPAVVESYKTYDDSVLIKTADVGQVKVHV
jgi:hypothetical protein